MAELVTGASDPVGDTGVVELSPFDAWGDGREANIALEVAGQLFRCRYPGSVEGRTITRIITAMVAT